MPKGNRTPRTEKQLAALRLPKTGKVGRPKGSTKPITKRTVSFHLSLEVVERLKLEPNSSAVVDAALRRHFNLPAPMSKNVAARIKELEQDVSGGEI
jgi:hypothetical protein